MEEKGEDVRNNVLLFRAPTEDKQDPYDLELKKHGYKSYSIPVLEFNFINLDKLTSSLQETNSHCAIVFTSQRAVDACTLALQQVDETSEKRQKLSSNLSCYVVGESTSKAATNAGFCPIGAASGNADKLAELIIKELKSTEKPLLYPCGNLRKDTLSEKLKQEGFTLNEIEVYETVRNKNIDTSVNEYLEQQGLPEYVVYFSPSGIQYTQDLIGSEVLPCHKLKVLAIGPTTEKELVKRGLPVYGVAKQPDPKGVAEVLLKDKS